MKLLPRLLTKFGMLIVSALLAQNASAAIIELDNSEMVIYAMSQAENGASVAISYNPSVTGCGGGLFYIAPEDKHMLATILSSQMSSIRVDIKYQDTAPSVTIASLGVTLNCKILAVWPNHLGY